MASVAWPSHAYDCIFMYLVILRTAEWLGSLLGFLYP
jgi:hypothetical protein